MTFVLKRDVKCNTANALLLNSLIQNNLCLFVLFNEMCFGCCVIFVVGHFHTSSGPIPVTLPEVFIYFYLLLVLYSPSFPLSLSSFQCLSSCVLVIWFFTVKISFLIFPYFSHFCFPSFLPTCPTPVLFLPVSCLALIPLCTCMQLCLPLSLLDHVVSIFYHNCPFLVHL